jgi:hypothetical protein
MPSPAGNSYTPGPDPDFSYLSLLQPNLLFVEDIQRYVDLGNSLGAMADSVQGQAGSSLLALRAQALQYAGQEAWGLMMASATQRILPLVADYTTALGRTISVYDTYQQTAANALTAGDLSNLKLFLADIPPDLLQYLQIVVNGPVAETTGDGALTATNGVDTWTSIEGFAEQDLAHEIGISVFQGALKAGDTVYQEWNGLWNASNDAQWDDMDFSYP